LKLFVLALEQAVVLEDVETREQTDQVEGVAEQEHLAEQSS
jgi:hypothetical protein